MEERINIYISIKYVSSFKRIQFNERIHINLLYAHFLYKTNRCCQCTSRSQKVVMNKYYIVRTDGICMDFDSIDTIFFIVTLRDGVIGKFTRFTDRNKSCIEVASDDRTDDKSA